MPYETNKSITIFKSPSWGVLGAAFLIMLVAKCFGFAPELPWLIVTAPLWGPIALTIGFFVGFYIFAILGAVLLLVFSAIILGIQAVVAGIIAFCVFIKNIFTRKDKQDGLHD